MSKFLSLSLTFFVSVVVAPQPEIHGQTAEKYALLIGVSEYEHKSMNKVPLRYPESDAASIKKLLVKSGYSVDILLGKEATKSAINSALKFAASQGKKNGAVLIGVFGHGVQYGNQDYICPWDAKLRNVTYSDGRKAMGANGRPMLEPDPGSLVPLEETFVAFRACGATNRILLADCCHEEPNRALGPVSDRNAIGYSLNVEQLPKCTVAFFACENGEKAFEHEDWGHGAFTYAFLKHAKALASRGPVTSGTLSDQMGSTIAQIVKEKTKGRSRQTMSAYSRGVRIDFMLNSENAEVITDSLGMELVRIPAGKFMMGSPLSETDRSDDEQKHEVRINREFFLGKHEVTQGQWRSLMGNEPWKGKVQVKEGRNYPASHISWAEAVEFCKRLSVKEGIQYRLPTEAEWEYSCRGGCQAAYSFGADLSSLDKYARFDENASDIGEQYAHQVGLKLGNEFGLHDMHGNVFEWCYDRYREDYRANSLEVDPKGAEEGPYRVIRGGSWFLTGQLCRSAFRSGSLPESRSNRLGFRVLRSE